VQQTPSSATQTLPLCILTSMRRNNAWLVLLLLVRSGQLVNGFVCPRQPRSTFDPPPAYRSYQNVCTSLGGQKFPEDPSDDDDHEESTLLPSADDDSSTKSEKTPQSTPSGEDSAKKFSVSRDKAISALSQPNPKDRAAISELSNSSSNNDEPTTPTTNDIVGNIGRPKKLGKLKSEESLLPKTGSKGSFRKQTPSGNGKRLQTGNPVKRERNSDTTVGKDKAYSFNSILPPPIKDPSSGSKNNKGDDSLSDGLSSWEDFLGGGGSSQPKQGFSSKNSPLYREMKDNRSSTANINNSNKRERYQTPGNPSSGTKKGLSSLDNNEKLPSIADLFPPGLSAALKRNKNATSEDGSGLSSVSPPPPALDGVLPVSDLFYRSAQSMNEDDESARDDEELPFSAEQSDQLTSEHNRIKVRRNQAKPASSSPSTIRSSPPQRNRNALAPRKMIRRGMEMLVGGVPINADPPQRYVDLVYQHENANWNEVISMNSRDFGPMWHSSSVGMVSKIEQGLFCEHFVHSALKWDVCPKDLKTIVKSYTPSTMDGSADKSISDDEVTALIESALDEANGGVAPEVEAVDNEDEYDDESSGQSFGTLKSFNKNALPNDDDESILQSHLGGELVFSIGVSREELESVDTPSEVPVLERVLARGIASSTECTGFGVTFTKLILTDLDDGTTMISGEFTLTLKGKESMNFVEMEKKAQRINSALAQAMDGGDMQLAMAAAAREETGWPEAVRDRVVEEFLFEEDDGDGPLDDDGVDQDTYEENSTDSNEDEADTEDELVSVNSLDEIAGTQDDYDGPFGMPGSVEYHKDDIFLGGGNDGVFWNYAEESAARSPYGGTLGLRLVDAVVERAKEKHPRVIAIGDVHGCIDELQDLLRQCDYRPGDLVVFLGDLVSKGPDSISVVQMAREIGAIGVRGNHDFEVIRWHQAIKSGVDPPVVGSEHFHIASCLSKGDMKWLYSLPWYLSSKELGTLFVHAGFVSGIRLAKQNPRLMMNMRSILPDGTVTSKFFNNWPWARLWDGPQTVLFGHDADRGLQQYENAIGLDTGCVYGGRLTACILPEKRLVSVSARREYFKYRRKHYD
jgi:hypothetical protein